MNELRRYGTRQETREEYLDRVKRGIDQCIPHLPISDYDANHVEEVMTNNTNFSACLLRLIAKADLHNRARLAVVYPDHVEAYEKWWKG